MEYNDLLNEFFDLLDNNKDIIRLKELKTTLLEDISFLEEIKKVRECPSVESKKKLYNQENYVEYLKLETTVQLLLQTIKQKLQFSSRSCIK